MRSLSATGTWYYSTSCQNANQRAQKPLQAAESDSDYGLSPPSILNSRRPRVLEQFPGRKVPLPALNAF